jgi:hypothetical protein
MPERGFLGSLFDVSFSSLITTKVIKVLYVLSMVMIGLGALVFIVAGFSNSGGSGVLALVLAPLLGLLYLIYVRVLLELVIAVFRIMETNVELVSLQRGGPATPPAGPAPAPPGLT